MGTRLGMSLPKALVEIRGKPILTRQLEMLAEVEDVVVVAGFRSQLVLDLLRAVRPNVRVALNHEFGSTGTAASVAKAAALAKDWVLALDGDLLVRPESAYGRDRAGRELFPGADVLHVGRTDHFGLLNHRDVHAALRDWLA